MSTLKIEKTADDYIKDRTFYNKLFSYAINLSKGNIQDANDLTQDVILTIKEKFNLYNNTNIPFINWSIVIMKNTFINRYRRRKKTKSFIINYDNVNICLEDSIPSHYNSPVEALIEKEKLASMDEIKYIINGSDRLPNDTKKAILLKMSGKKIREISENLNIPFNTTKRLIYTKIKKIPEYDKIKELFYAHYK
jgi:RNA polymerase sigma factor (sigma-70 family)